MQVFSALFIAETKNQYYKFKNMENHFHINTKLKMENDMIQLFLSIYLLLGSSSFAQSNPENTGRYFVNIVIANKFTFGTAEVGTAMTALPSHIVGSLNCQGSFRSKDIFQIQCSSGDFIGDENATFNLKINNSIGLNQKATLSIRGSGTEGMMDVTLHCNAKDQLHPDRNITCK